MTATMTPPTVTPSTWAPDAAGPPGSRVARLAADAAEAAQVRTFQTDPDVVALRVERVRSQVDRLMWSGIVLGLSFTMVNVQAFAAAGAVAWSPPWLVAWLLDPMVSLVLIAVLRAEQVTARHQVACGVWPRRAKWFTLAATYVMNTWASYAAGSLSGIVLHSVPPLVVFVAAEAVTDLRDKLTESVYRAHDTATTRARRAGGAPHPASASGQVTGPTPAPPPVPTAPVAPSTRQGSSSAPARVRDRAAARRKPSAGRVLFADYLTTARAAFTPGTTVTPAWVREVTGCSRGLSSRLAAALRAETDQTPPPAYQPGPPAQRREGTDSNADQHIDQDADEAEERAA